ncbi:hypothetical protein RAS2_34750 [Phycisphaerae bacterium RAS2]|nr:hypothetical protein RAS2_34750 [Phycisphaerae bacterium RAS2]
MTDASPATAHHAHSAGRTLIRQIRLLSGLAVAAAIFWYVGPWALGHVDPGGPVSLIDVPSGLITMAELLGLAIVSSGLAVAIAGAGSAARGPLAVAVGLAALAARGAQMDKLVLQRVSMVASAAAGGGSLPDPYPTWGLAAETWLWLGLIAVGYVAGRWVDGWFETRPAEPRPVGPSDIRQSAGAVAISTVVAWLVISFAIGRENAPILRGQVYFAVAFGFVTAALVAHACFDLRSSLWALLCVGIVATVAFVVGAPSSAAVAQSVKTGSYLMLRPMTRPLPIEYAALGAIGALIQQDARVVLRATFGMSAQG